MNAWLPSAFIAGVEFLILWGLVLLSLYAKSVPLVPCQIKGAVADSVCPAEVGLALLFSVLFSVVFIVIALVIIKELMESKAYRREVYLFATLGGIVGAIDLYYLTWDMVLPLIMKFYEFEGGLSPPAIVIGFFIIVGLIYFAILVACEIEEKQERMEKARKDIEAQAAANKPQG
jgi:hypothetical protein